MRKISLLVASLFAAYIVYIVQSHLNKDSVPLISPLIEAEPIAVSAATQTLAWWDQQLADTVSKNEWRAAADLVSRKAAYHRSVNELEQAIAADQLSNQYLARDSSSAASTAFEPTAAELQAVTLEPYVSVPSAASPTPAKFEPQSGVYLGMLGADKRVAFNMNNIESVYGRKHAIYLSYVGWRKVQTNPTSYFPVKTAETVKALGGALQIGWEPRYGLDDVQDDEYVRTFAREAKASGIPVFLRYASEMNGAWVPWHGNPKKYIEKFRLIHKIMKEEAPNVVMVWSPNFMPMDNIDDYYPGDEYVDWIGYSLYAVGGPGDTVNDKSGFLQSFQPLSGKFPGKPIMISEGAVSHYNLTTNQSYERWAEGQLGDLYGYLARMYPRVKAITYFNFGKERAIRSKMDAVYDLGENPFADLLYRRSIQDDLFLSHVEEGARTNENVNYIPWSQASKLQGKHTVFTHVSMPQSKHPFAIAYYQDGKQLGITYELPWEMELDFSKLDPSQPLAITAFNRSMEKLAEASIPLPK
ncbi:glycoside hydrolase family 26 protein [Paenibacillus radicis (ex Xue et al. 2023)]|uniref:Glycoside hydrolase family 26 protein n=1 Tax=Paenibacillus radicis (ex Xue et al. 2023) TaxID=2972489 RepID=A0ABT1YEL7_9BACL|nr:glycoside hydrolase family 26 protein [Paenibacillus radicis (ex Xue et al. 2023)]MCR8631362.1 glycoside hydrolase family 26 protein [Paenibacillus radicis (ex Xue et al. 2023)]